MIHILQIFPKQTESRATYISTAAKIFLLLNLYTKNREES